MDKQKSKLSNNTVIFMIAVALLYDLLSAGLNLVFMGWLVAPVAGLHFWLWFKFKDISFMTPKRLATGSASLLLEVFPLTSWLPAWTGAVAVVIADVKMKEKAGI